MTTGKSAGAEGRVLLVVDSLAGGGAEQHVLDLAVGLRGRGWDISIACSSAAPEPTEGSRWRTHLGSHGVGVHDLTDSVVKRRMSLAYAVRLRRLVSVAGFGLVHAHIYASELAAALAVTGAATPLVVTEHTEGPWRGPFARLASKRIYRRAGRIIVVSEAIAELLRNRYGVSADKIAVVLPVGGRTPSTPAPARSSGSSSPPVIGYVGRLQPEKGVDVLLQAMVQVLGAVPAARLVVVGDGPRRASLEALARQLGIAGAVSFLGHRQSVAEVLDAFDVMVVPSRTDGSPLVVHEALCAGVPVVASRVGGIVDRLGGGTAGVLVPPGDPVALARAVCALLVDPKGRDRLADAGRRLAATVTFEGMLDAVEEVYRSSLRERAVG